jgi:Tripartite tricarboxylate transporter TctB family
MQSKTFWAGAMLCAIGIAAAIGAPHYRMGTLAQMGPGYFPLILGVLLAALGAITCLQAVAKGGGDRLTTPPWRQLICIPLCVVSFALLVERAGLAIAVVVTVLIGCLGGHRFRPIEAVISAIVLAVLTCTLFVRLLGLPVTIGPTGL